MNLNMRKGLVGCGIFLLLAVLLWALHPGNTPEATEPTLPTPEFSLAATHAFVYDSGRDILLFTKGDAQAQLPMASLTKLFTCYVALQYLEPETVVTAGNEVELIHPESSTAYIRPGHKLTVDMLVQGVLLPSGNDAAYVLAAAAGRAAENDPNMDYKAAAEAFVAKMNAQALAVGMKNTHFANPDGMDEKNHYTCLADLVIMGKVALQNATIARHAATAQADVTYASGQTNTWINSNLLLQKNSGYYEEKATGLKTGTTNGAGNCLLSSFQTEDGYLLIGVLGCPEDADRYQDTLRLYTYSTTGRAMTVPGDEPA